MNYFIIANNSKKIPIFKDVGHIVREKKFLKYLVNVCSNMFIDALKNKTWTYVVFENTNSIFNF